MFRRLGQMLATNWPAVRVIVSFFVLIVIFFSMLTYTPFVRHIDIAAGLAKVSAVLSWVLLRGLGVFMGYDVTRNGHVALLGWKIRECSWGLSHSLFLGACFSFLP